MKPTWQFRYVRRLVTEYGKSELVLQQWWEETSGTIVPSESVKGEWTLGEWRDVPIEEEK